MSRTLKRPMFRMGGSTENSGIMDNMRNRYDKGGSVEDVLKQLDETISQVADEQDVKVDELTNEVEELKQKVKLNEPENI